MNIEVSWDDEAQTIIRYDYGPDWTWEEFREATAISNQMLASVSHRVDFITDFSSASPPPMGALSRFKQAQEGSPPNLGVIVIVGGSLFINTLVSTFSRVYRALGEQLMVANSVEEARAKIDELRFRRDAG